MTLTVGMKVHLRVLAIRGVTLRVVTLRPQDTVRFSTNYYHDTWHILANAHGAIVLGRLLWGLAFQKQPGTLVLIDEPHLRPTPFEADRADPIALVPDGLTTVDDDLLRALRVRLRRSPGPPTTIRWHTFGMVAALACEDRNFWRFQRENRTMFRREQMSRRAGTVCYTAPQPVLRETGLGIYQMHQSTGGSYFPLAATHATGCYGIDGEFQLIEDFDSGVSAAIAARREVLGEDAPRRLLADDDVRWDVYRRKDALLAARRRHRP